MPSSEQPIEYPPSHWTDAEKAEYQAKLDVAERAMQLDWHDKSFVQSFETCGSAGLGVILAGAFFPFVMALFVIVVIAFNQAFSGGWIQVAAILGSGLAFSVFGVIAAILAQVVAMCVISLLNTSFGFGINARRQVLMTGGLAGFLCLGWVTGISADQIPSDAMIWVGITLLVVFVAMLHGHLGALWGALRTGIWYASIRAKQTEKPSRPNQLGLANLFWITCWFAIVFALQRVTKFQIARAVVIYIILQSILIGVDALWLRFRNSKNPNP